MRKRISIVIVALMILLLVACSKKPEVTETQEQQVQVMEVPQGQEGITQVGLDWKATVLKSSKVGEIDNAGIVYEVYISNDVKYIYNTATQDLYTGNTLGDANATVLKDWIVPYGEELLKKEDALFDATWEYTSERARGLLGYCEAHYKLITKARTAEYVEYIYQDVAEAVTYRIAITDDYILFAPLVYSYVFDINAY